MAEECGYLVKEHVYTAEERINILADYGYTTMFDWQPVCLQCYPGSCRTSLRPFIKGLSMCNSRSTVICRSMVICQICQVIFQSIGVSCLMINVIYRRSVVIWWSSVLIRQRTAVMWQSSAPIYWRSTGIWLCLTGNLSAMPPRQFSHFTQTISWDLSMCNSTQQHQHHAHTYLISKSWKDHIIEHSPTRALYTTSAPYMSGQVQPWPN